MSRASGQGSIRVGRTPPCSQQAVPSGTCPGPSSALEPRGQRDVRVGTGSEQDRSWARCPTPCVGKTSAWFYLSTGKWDPLTSPPSPTGQGNLSCSGWAGAQGTGPAGLPCPLLAPPLHHPEPCPTPIWALGEEPRGSETPASGAQAPLAPTEPALSHHAAAAMSPRDQPGLPMSPVPEVHLGPGLGLASPPQLVSGVRQPLQQPLCCSQGPFIHWPGDCRTCVSPSPPEVLLLRPNHARDGEHPAHPFLSLLGGFFVFVFYFFR